LAYLIFNKLQKRKTNKKRNSGWSFLPTSANSKNGPTKLSLQCEKRTKEKKRKEMNTNLKTSK